MYLTMRNKINISSTVEEAKEILKKSKKDLYKIFLEATKDLNKKCEVSLNIKNSNEIHKINLKYRNVNKTTDVISFPNYMRDNKYLDLGDIFINGEILKKQAKEINSDEYTELKFLFMHGLLHLLGYDHQNKEDEKKMILKQKEIFKNTKIRN
ncbi:MAG: endoribonuclease YbeY [Candidatus Hepatoplasma vulgare]|nr:MAG: endoribonuclease YbeY [Candidatus Hepatoplasma sp.]